MSIWNIAYRSQLKEGLNILAEHYQKERIINEQLLQSISSNSIQYYFFEKTKTIQPEKLDSSWKVYDLPDTLSNFLLGGKNPNIDKVTSNKKIAESDDFVISRLRYYLNEMAIVPESIDKFAISTEYLVFSSKSDIPTHILLPFILSKYVQSILKWAQTGNAHPRFSSGTLKKISIPDILVQQAKSFEIEIITAINKLKLSDELYKDAITLLNNSLGINSIDFNCEKYYRTSYLDIINSHRLDSSHFKIKYNQLIEHLTNNFQTVNIANISKLNRRGLQPKYVKDGEIDVVNSQHITSSHLTYDEFEKTSSKYYYEMKEAQLEKGDILTYTTGAYIGATNPYLSNNKAIASNHVNILRLNNKEIDPIYLALVLNSDVGRIQTEKHQRGSAQAELYPNDIAKFTVPIIDKAIMNEVGNKIRKSLEEKNLSKLILKQSINRIENLIEQEINC